MTKELTNKRGFSQMMMDVFQPEPRVRVGGSDYSATSLIDPPRKVQLCKRYEAEIQYDAFDQWSLFLGSAIHKAIEDKLKKKQDKYLVECKITNHDRDRRVVAIFDAYDRETKTIYDHKTTTVFIHGSEAKEEWAKQLNINAYFLEKEGFKVDRAKINAIYVDWRAGIAKFKKAEDYPPLPVAEFEVPLAPQSKREEYYLAMLDKHIAAESLPDDKLPLCTADEMWEKTTTWAVKQRGVYVAKRVLHSEEEANAWLENNKNKFKNLYIEKRPGTRTRCESYCNAAPFCNQYKQYLKEQEAASA